jgi:8-amino-7-oxononanoate synthase
MFPTARVHLAMGTLSKALGSFGGYVCADKAVIDLLKTRARSSVFATALPPASAAAALAALQVVQTEPQRVAAVLAKARAFTDAAGLPPAQSAIVPVILGSAQAALDAQAALETQGLLAMAIRPPTVPKGAARLRLAFSAAHDFADIDRLAAAVRAQ